MLLLLDTSYSVCCFLCCLYLLPVLRTCWFHMAETIQTIKQWYIEVGALYTELLAVVLVAYLSLHPKTGPFS